MAKCLRCGAGNEWIQGRVPDEPPVDDSAATARAEAAERKFETKSKYMLLEQVKRQAAEREAGRLKRMPAELIADLDLHWQFDNGQVHTHTWHTKQDFLEKWRAKLKETPDA